MAYSPAVKRETKRVQLVTQPLHWVDVYVKLNWGDEKKLSNMRKKLAALGSEAYEIAVDDALAVLIADWSLDDENGNKLPITQENIDLMVDVDMQVVVDAITPIIFPKQDDSEEAAEQAEKKGNTSKSSLRTSRAKKPNHQKGSPTTNSV